VLAEEGDVGIGQGGRGALALLEEAGDSLQGDGVGVAGTKGELLAFEFGLVGVAVTFLLAFGHDRTSLLGIR